MINDIRNEAKRRNLMVKEHSKNLITVFDPTYTKTEWSTNYVRVECKVSKGITHINIGFTDFHKKDFLENCSDWDLHYTHPQRSWAWKPVADVSEFFTIYDQIKDDWKQHIYLDNKIKSDRYDVMLFIAEDWYNCLSKGFERFITRERLDLIDGVITINEPLPKYNWREHIVPCEVLRKEAKRIFLNGGTKEDIAEMLHKNLYIVNIHEQDARRLDGELGLRDSMPEGWEFGDCIFARLDEAKINY